MTTRAKRQRITYYPNAADLARIEVICRELEDLGVIPNQNAAIRYALKQAANYLSEDAC